MTRESSFVARHSDSFSVRRLLHLLRWTLSLGNKFRKEVPLETSTVVVATLVAQVAMLLAFFLPLKILILLGSEGIPRYFPPAFESFDRDVLIGWLTAASVVFYLVHLLAEKVLAVGTERGARELIRKTRKLILFENQNQVAARSYRLYVQALAGAVFFTLSLGVLAWLYPAITLILVVYSLSVFLVVLVAFVASARLAELLQETQQRWIPVAANVGFLLAFFFLVYDFLHGSPPGLIAAIIALILSKRAFGNLSASLVAIAKLTEQRDRVNALFFHGHMFLQAENRRRRTAWDLLMPQERQSWVPTVLANLTGGSVEFMGDIQWCPIAERRVGALRVGTPDGESYLIKLYDQSRSTAAHHEANLLRAMGRQLPVPEFLGTHDVEGCSCNVFRLPSGADLTRAVGIEQFIELRETLLSIRPRSAVINQYERSHPFIWDRLKSEPILARLHVASGEDLTCVLHRLESRLDEWCERLQEIPLAITLPHIHGIDVLYVGDGTPVTMGWSRWSIEPAGFNWRGGGAEMHALNEALMRSAARREDLSKIIKQQAMLAMLTGEVEALWRGQRFESALALLPEVEACLDRIGQAVSETGKGA